MARIIVLDTCALVSYFSKIFKEPRSISTKSLQLIEKTFSHHDLRMIIPSIVFIEIFQVFGRSKEEIKKISYEVLQPIMASPYFEIRPLDKEVLLFFIQINDRNAYEKFDNHDKQILSTAILMNCPLMTTDQKIINYNERKKVIPQILQ